MRLTIGTKVLIFPKRVSPGEALDFYRHQQEKHDVLMVMAADWRVNSEPGEEDWFEELTADEFDQEDFLKWFATARLELWVR